MHHLEWGVGVSGWEEGGGGRSQELRRKEKDRETELARRTERRVGSGP